MPINLPKSLFPYFVRKREGNLWTWIKILIMYEKYTTQLPAHQSLINEGYHYSYYCSSYYWKVTIIVVFSGSLRSTLKKQPLTLRFLHAQLAPAMSILLGPHLESRASCPQSPEIREHSNRYSSWDKILVTNISSISRFLKFHMWFKKQTSPLIASLS